MPTEGVNAASAVGAAARKKASVNGYQLVPLPAGLSTRQAMAVGTAGFTAMLAVI